MENFLRKKRGYVFRMPKPGSPVVLLLSGGLDSIVSWGILMKEFKLPVYPLFFDRGEKRHGKERDAINFFSSYYKKQFSNLYHAPYMIDLGIKNTTLPILNSLEHLHPRVVLENFTGNESIKNINISFGSFLIFPAYGKVYSEFLYHTKNIRVQTIFCSIIPGDGLLIPHQTFTSLRRIMFYLCVSTGNFSWQFASPIFEKEIGAYVEKFSLIQWANMQGIPLEKTWSCYHSSRYQCGGSDCQTCRVRRNAFHTSRIVDKTMYRSLSEQSILHFIRRLCHAIGI
jgi:ferredoxin